ncbi:threonine--tRNA ligase [Alphaproteobacteria bacterium]|nr:threonine--tRNA ligase [Alphaproteobacteria bacterium]
MNDNDLKAMRHSAEHALTMAMKKLYPGLVEAMGPATDSGFYFDFELPSGQTITPDDFPRIEAAVADIIAADLPVTQRDMTEAEARKLFAANPYKMEWIGEIAGRGQAFSTYAMGDFTDLCAGPHAVSTGKIGAFKLLSVAGAYWRGDSKNKMLIRLYGTAFPTEQELADYLRAREEAEKRDHRRLGREMSLFMFDEHAPGDVFWLPRGWTMFQGLISYMRARQDEAGYIEINTPQIMDKSLWETSGHWDWYRANMFTTEVEDRTFAIKPMNCPGGILVYKRGLVSYRDLPLRVAEFGRVHRYEASGALHGLLRVRAFTQDDAHIFCTPAQLEAECQTVIKLMLDIYRDFGLDDVAIYLSTRPAERIGDDALWDTLEKALGESLEKLGYKYEVNAGDGAFYGPKLDFKVKDALGRWWQLGTLQADMNLPERFDISYIAEDGAKHRPIMLHRALFGSLERFAGAYLEITAGHLPLWLAPVQAMVATITDEAAPYAARVVDACKTAGLRADSDTRGEKIGYKIREHSAAKVPVLLVAGRKEAEAGEITVRRLGSQEQQTLPLAECVALLKRESALPSVKYQR